MKRFIVRSLAVIGAMVLVECLVVGGYFLARKGRVPSRVILEVNFERPLIEYVPDDTLAQFTLRGPVVVRDVVDALERAASDKRVVALVARTGEGPGRLAHIQEVRDAVMSFRRSGKPAIAFAETFGEGGAGNLSYYLATAFDEIHLQPSGDVGLTGLLKEQPFLRGTLDKLGLFPRMDHRYEYKNAMNFFTEKKFTGPHREAVTSVMDSQFGQMVKGIATARKLTELEARALADRGPFLGKEAMEVRLVDGLAYRDELYDRLKEKHGKDVKFLSLGRYLEQAGRTNTKGQTIALIYGVGGIERGKSGYDALMREIKMGSDTVAGAFRAAIEDKKVKAILFRVDSPGGSYVASDTIWREVVHARKAGKPVVVSMSGVAGSGGYFVAMHADKIVAQPGTITGSIGVLAGKFITTNFWDKVGISWDEVHTSTNAAMFTGLQDYTPEQWAKFQQWLDRIYEDFTDKVADGRHLPKERVLEIAKGRIWTGEDAKALGLVDELGGFDTALRLAREAAGISAAAEIRLKEFPPKKTLLARLLECGSINATVDTLDRALQFTAPIVRALNTDADTVALTMPDADWGY